MQKAAALAGGDLLLFTDADIIHEPHTLATAVAEIERLGLDFLSLFPRMDTISLWENIVVPTFVGGLAMLASPGIENPESSEALGRRCVSPGPCVGLSRDRRLRANSRRDGRRRGAGTPGQVQGYRVGFRFAPEFLHVRIYKGNRHAFWAMTKNVLIGIEGRLWFAPFVMVLPAFAFWTPIYCAIAGVIENNAALAADRSSRLHHGLCSDVARPPAVSVSSAQGPPLSAGRRPGDLLHGPCPLPLSGSRRGGVARSLDPRA